MRLLIDGYNLMHALGLLGKRLPADGLRRVRHRFLNDLAARLGPVEANQATVVFDASAPPERAPTTTHHKGMTVVFAVDAEDADSHIERLIADHSAPKTLTVVSSDARLRRAAARRKATALGSDAFWSRLEARRPVPPASPSPEEKARLEGPSPAEAAFWLRAFSGLDADPDLADAPGAPSGFAPTADEIARIEREIDEEDRGGPPPRRRGRRD